MAGGLIATVKGRMQLVIGDGEPIDLGGIEIPVTADAVASADGSLVLHAKPNMREVRDFFEQVFGAEIEHRAKSGEGA